MTPHTTLMCDNGWEAEDVRRRTFYRFSLASVRAGPLWDEFCAMI
jgi:hypothetical protein